MQLSHRNAVHLWQINLNDEKWDGDATLSAQEIDKMRRFKRLILQQHYGRCHRALRSILARYLDQSPESLIFLAGEFGKPQLACGSVHFNLSHSGEFALLAVARDALGVDLEWMRRDEAQCESLMEMIAHPKEMQHFSQLGLADRPSYFYATWTRKEAYCKLLGVGLHKTLADVYFEPMSADLAVVMDAADAAFVTDARDPTFVHTLSAPVDYAASLCCTMRTPDLQWFEC